MTQRNSDKQKPEILAQEIVAQSRLFKIEQLFSTKQPQTPAGLWRIS